MLRVPRLAIEIDGTADLFPKFRFVPCDPRTEGTDMAREVIIPPH